MRAFPEVPTDTEKVAPPEKVWTAAELRALPQEQRDAILETAAASAEDWCRNDHALRREEPRQEIAVGIEQAERGEVAPLDMDAVRAKVADRFKAQEAGG